MRIGILTHPLATNYGGLLQAYALQQILIRDGHDVITINCNNRVLYTSFIRQFLGWLKRKTRIEIFFLFILSFF